MRNHQIPGVLLLGLLLGLPVNGRAESIAYAYVSIADITQPGGLSVVGPSINSGGTVAFLFLPVDPVYGGGIFTGNGGPLTTIITSRTADSRPSINDAGQVSFRMGLGFGSGVFTGSGGPLTTIASGPSSFFGVYTSINNAGTVAFFALPAEGPRILVGAGGPITTIADSSGPFSDFPDADPAINKGGTVAFFARLKAAGGFGIFTGSGGPTTTIADNSGPFRNFLTHPTINDFGIVSFRADQDGGRHGIFKGDGTTITTIADTEGPFGNFLFSSINNAGLVAFHGFLDAPGEGIYTGPDPSADKVIASGDPLFGSTVQEVLFGPEGLNDSGQVAFLAALTDGRVVVVRADPFISVNIDIKPGGMPNPINRKSKGNVPVALLSSATFDATAADRATVTFAGAPALNIGGGFEDVNGDGLLDSVFHFDTQSLTLPNNTTSACMTGQTRSGRSFKGCDSVRLVQ